MIRNVPRRGLRHVSLRDTDLETRFPGLLASVLDSAR